MLFAYRPFLAVSAAICAIATAGAAAPPAKTPGDIESAAIQMKLEVVQWNSRRHECAKLVPKYGPGMARFYIQWLDANRDSVMGMISYFVQKAPLAPILSVANVPQIDGVIEEESQRLKIPLVDLCISTFLDLKDGNQDFSTLYPDSARLLGDYLAAHPLTVAVKRHYDNPMGCAKAALNNKQDFERALPVCQCNWDAVNGEFSQAEWAEFESTTHTRSADEARNLPQFKRVLPKIVECAKRLESEPGKESPR
jgi:hypothetical protein